MEDKDKNVHGGHRDRIKDKFLKNGLDDLELHETLEFLLYYAVPRRDTNPISHRLIDKFGSFSAVFDASLDSLVEEGISKNTAILIKMIPELCREYLDDKNRNKNKIINMSSVGDLFVDKFVGRECETVILLLTDAKHKEVFCGVINKGSISSCELYLKTIVKYAMQYNARYAVISHNHTSGLALPSKGDLIATRKIFHALALLDVKLVDHIIVADDDYVSISQTGILKEIFTNNYYG